MSSGFWGCFCTENKEDKKYEEKAMP